MQPMVYYYVPRQRKRSGCVLRLFLIFLIGSSLALLWKAGVVSPERLAAQMRALGARPTPIVLRLAPSSDEPEGNPLRDTRVVLTQGYGVGSHAPAATWGGIDLAIDSNGDGDADPQGTTGAPIYATHSGVARVKPDSWPGGNYLAIESQHYKTAYAHLKEYAVQDGQPIVRGQVVGYVGSTGQASGAHLHYEVWRDGQNVNPLDYAALFTFTPGGRFGLYVEAGLYVNERPFLPGDLDAALEYVTQRFGSGPAARFTAGIFIDGQCMLHGLAYTDKRNLQVLTCNGVSRDRAVSIMAHEFVHQLEGDRYGPAHFKADLILSEGVATWGAGKYWLGGVPDFRSYVHRQRQSGVSYPLAMDYFGLDVAAKNALYYQWASFVEYLIGSYGREKLDRLYVTGQSSPGSADYLGVYGKDLEALEQEWIAWLETPS